ncbi:MAG: hypothetical protein PHN44_09195 [Candidatus Marinimicrobia bacterium]|jgi:hypothetical protein|nr:hypothetical protein [Candidatus Neomarinimicrobiota bacterium]
MSRGKSNKPQADEQELIIIPEDTDIDEPERETPRVVLKITAANYAVIIEALKRISIIHNHATGSCSKNCPAFIASEALRKIRG